MEKVHLKHDLDINKAVVKRQVDEMHQWLPEDEFIERGFAELKELLDRRTQVYTLEEAGTIVDYYTTSHDDCVVDNPYDHTPLEVYQARAKWDRQLRAQRILERLSKL